MKYIFITVSAILALFLQFFLAPVITYAGIGPDFIILFLICVYKYCGASGTIMLASLLGSFYDVTCNGNIFINTVAYLFIAFGLAVVKLVLDKHELMLGIICIATAVLIKGLLTTFGLYIIELTKAVDFIFFIKAIPSALINIVLYVPSYFVFTWIFSIKFGRPRSNILPN